MTPVREIVTEAERTFTFDWRSREHAQVVAMLLRERTQSGIWRLARWLILAVLIFTGALIIVTLAGDRPSAAVALGPWALLLALLTYLWPDILARLQAWRVARQDPNVGHPITHSLGPSRLRISMKTIDVELKWSGLYGVRETRDLFLFYYSAGAAYYLPKRAITDEDRIAEVRAWIRERLPPGVDFVDR